MAKAKKGKFLVFKKKLHGVTSGRCRMLGDVDQFVMPQDNQFLNNIVCTFVSVAGVHFH